MARIAPLSFVARFAIVSAVLLGVAGIVLAQILTGTLVARAEEQAAKTGAVAVRLGIATRLDAQDFNGVVGAEQAQALDSLLMDARRQGNAETDQGYHALRVKVFNKNGLIVYSDLSNIVGKTYTSEDLDRAFRGEVVSKTTLMEDPDEQSDQGIKKALEVYVPVSYGQSSPIGVVEVYLPYEPVSRGISTDTRSLYVALAATLLVFYLLMFRMVARASRRLREGAARNEYLAHHDPLTGLPNRSLLLDRLERAVLSARRHGADVGVLLVDLDRFKEINDTLGHEVGDLLLQQVGDRIADVLRDVDTVARLGGDEFVVVLPDVEDVLAACLVAQRLLDQLHRPFIVRGVGLAVEASIGIACFPEHGQDHGLLLQHADVAMYVAKQSRGAYAVYDPDTDDSSLSRITLLDELRNALERDELVLYYQPKVQLSDGTVRSVEALLRWYHPTRGIVPPDDFIPLAEQTGLISALTENVLRQALRQVRAWKEEGRDISVSVNLSARNLTDGRLPQVVQELLALEGVEPNWLEVEVTETSAMADPARAANVLHELSELGVAVSVDDYGTGYSSLSYLRSLPIGTLKIDRSFVTDMLINEENAVIVRSTIELARNLDLKVVAEGVEDVETCQALAGLGCDVAQGYYVSRPLPAADLAGLLDRLAPPAPSGSVTALRRDAIIRSDRSGSRV